MAAESNDVVRHVILRILVDQAGLAEELAAARAKLKELENAEKESNKNRSADAQKVTKAYDDQAEAIRRNADAVEKRQQASRRDASTTADDFKESTRQIDQSTKQQLDAVDKIDQARDKDHKRELDRSKAEGQAERDLFKVKEETAAKISREQQKLNQDLASKQYAINDAEMLGNATRPARLEALLHDIESASGRLKADAQAAEHVAETRRHESTSAGHNADTAGVLAEAAAQRVAADMTDRRARSLRDARSSQQALKNLASEGNVLEQKALAIAEQRVAAEMRVGQEVDKQNKGLKGWFQGFGNLVQDVAVIGGRAAASAPQSAVRGAQRAGQDFDQRRGVPKFGDPLRDVVREASTGEKVIASFFRSFGKGAEDSLRSAEKLKAGFRSFFQDISRGLLGGGGSNIFQQFAGDVFTMAESLNVKLGDIGKHFASMETIIIAVVAALGPLAAILGAVGAAALGLASNLVALSGVLFALPGVLTALVGGFGALAIVMKPLSNLFSAYSAAQKEAVTNTNSAKSALLDYKDAVLQQQDAEVAYNRAVQDGPRLQTALNDARKQAARDIEDYRTALKRLKYDEEGSQLGVESAQEQARRAVADPTASSLDRREALHNLQGALLDQQDQATQAKRTREDAAEAFKKGVNGSDAVVAANRAVEDSVNKIKEAYDAWQKSIIATQKAALASQAGGSAAATLAAQLDALPPKTRKVAQAILDILNGPWKTFRKALSENVFGPLSGSTGKFADVLKELSDFLTPSAKAMGLLAKNALDLLTSPDWKQFITETGKNSAGILQAMGSAALSVADGLMRIMRTAAPFTSWLVGAIAGVAKEFDNWTKSTSGQNGLVNFLDNTKKRIQELWPIIKNFAAGFAGFFSALNSPGGDGKEDFTTRFNNGLLSASKAFRKLGDEAAKPNSGFRKWLSDVIPLIKGVVGFLASAGAFFGKLFSDPRNINEAKDILKELATKWLPQLSEIFTQIAASGLISKLATGIGAVFGGIEKFLKNGGVDDLKIIADDIKRAGDVLGGLINAFSSMPGLLKVVGDTIAFVFGVSLIAKFSGLTGLLKGVFGLIRSIVGIVKNVKNVPLDGEEESTGRRGGASGGSAGTGGKRPTEPTGGGGGSTRTDRSGRTIGPVGEDTQPKPSRASRVRTRIGNIIKPNSRPSTPADPRNIDRQSGGFGATLLGSRLGQLGTTVKNQTVAVGSGLGQLGTTAKNEAVSAVTGSSKTSAVLARIEQYAKRIADNTRRGGAGSGSSTGSRSTQTGEERPTPSSTRRGSKPVRETPYGGTVSVGQSGEGSVRNRIDSRGETTGAGLGQRPTGTLTTGRTLGYSDEAVQRNAQQYPGTLTENVQTRDTRRHPVGIGPATDEKPARRSGALSSPDTVGAVPGQETSRRQTTTTGYSPERVAANVRREKVGLKPLPPDITTTPERAGKVDSANRQIIQEQEDDSQLQRQRNTGASSTINESTPVRSEPGGTVPYVPGSPAHREAQAAAHREIANSPAGRQARLDAAARNEAQRQAGTGGVIPFTDDAAVRSRDRTRYNSPDSREQRLDDVATREQARLGTGAGVVPRLDPVPEKVKGQSPKQRRKQALAERVAQRSTFSDEPLSGGRHSGTPIADVGRDTRPYGLDEGFTDELGRDQNVPTKRQMRAPQAKDPVTGKYVKQARDPKTGRFLPQLSPEVEPGPYEPEPAKKQPRTTGGQFGSIQSPDPVRNAKGQFKTPKTPIIPEESEPTSRRDRRRRSLEQQQHTGASEVDEGVEVGGAAEQEPSTKRKRLRDRIFPQGDEGSVGLGIGTRDDEETGSRRSTTTRLAEPTSRPGALGRLFGGKGSKAKPAKPGGKRGGLLGRLLPGVGMPVVGDDDYDEGYGAGYADALGQSGGGQQPGGSEKDKRGKKGKGRRGKSTSVAEDIEEVEQSTGGRGGRRSATTGIAEDIEEEVGQSAGRGGSRAGGIRRFFGGRGARGAAAVAEEGIEDVAKGGGRSLLGKVGGGLVKGLGGGLAGLALTGAADIGGEMLTDKFVKNDKDKGSLNRAIGAVSTGAGIGATIGSIIPGVGTAVGGAVGGAIGGIYSLFKDKNLRDFVEKKLGNLGGTIADGLKTAVSAVGNFVKFLAGKWLDLAKFWFITMPLAIGKFLLITLPGFVQNAVVWVLKKFLDLLKFWYIDLPLAVAKFLLFTLPGYVEKAVVWVAKKWLELAKFWFITMPLAVGKFLLITLPGYVEKAVAWLLTKFLEFLKFWYITLPLKVLGFFVQLGVWAADGVKFLLGKFVDFLKFWYIDLPLKVLGFFKQLGVLALDGAKLVGQYFLDHFITPLTDFFTKKIPEFFTKTIPDAIGKIGSFLKGALITPFTDFFAALGKHNFGYWLLHPAEIVGVLQDTFVDKKMSGGLIQGVYQGVQDTAHVMATPGEFMVRKSKVDEPGAKAFLNTFNEQGMTALYGGLAASTAPQVMSMVPPEARALTGAVPTVVNHTVNHAPVMGDVTINNPVREKSEATLRRQIHIAAIRHRR